MLRPGTTEEMTPSEQELAAEQAEARKSAAEKECLILSENKKTLESTSATIEEEIKLNKVILENSRGELLIAQNEVLEIRNTVGKEKIALTKILQDKKDAEKDLEDFKLSSASEKDAIKADIKNTVDGHVALKATHEKELKDITDSKNSLVMEFETLKISKEKVAREVETTEASLTPLQTSVALLNTDKQTVQKEIENLKGDSRDLETENEKKKLLISTAETTLTSINAEVETVKVGIEKKKQELVSLEKKAFVILEKSDSLDQRETFLRSQYERAGIKWE